MKNDVQFYSRKILLLALGLPLLALSACSSDCHCPQPQTTVVTPPSSSTTINPPSDSTTNRRYE